MRAENNCAYSPPKAYSRNRSGTEDCTQRNADLESGRGGGPANRRATLTGPPKGHRVLERA